MDDPERSSYLVQEGAGPVARAGAGRPGGVGAGAGRGRAARGSADGRRGAARGGRDARRPRAGGAGAGAGAGRAGAVPGAALGVARHRAVPGRPAGGGPRRACKRARAMLVDELGLDPGPRARRARAAAAAAGPVVDSAGREARSAPSAPIGGCCRTTPRTPTRSSAARTTSRRACGGCGTRGCWRSSALRDREVLARPRRRGRRPDPRRDAGAGDHAGCASAGLARRVEAAGPPDPGGGPGRGGGHAVPRPRRTGDATSPRWPPTWAPAARWSSRCAPTTSATWRRTRTSRASSRTASTCSAR